MISMALIKDKFDAWEKEAQARFDQLKSNEEELNKIFINLYGLQDELDYHVKDEEISVSLADKERDIKSLISYAVGCMFGRYSLDEDGLVFAGGEFDPSRYKKFKPDADNILLLTDDEYSQDDESDIVIKFVKFIATVYGQETLEENLDYIADVLPGGGKSRDKIRKYFVSKFYTDHLKTYKKRPIYWQFESGKANGAKALMYLHRYKPDQLTVFREDILPKLKVAYESQLELRLNQYRGSVKPKEKKEFKKKSEQLSKKLNELLGFSPKLAELGMHRIDLDLDDGVVANYDKLQTTPDGRVIKILSKR